MPEFTQLTQEQMVELSKQVNSGVNDPGISEDEAAARKAAADAAKAPSGSMNASEMEAAEATKAASDTAPAEPEKTEDAKSEDTSSEGAGDEQESTSETPATPFPTSDDIHLNSALRIMQAAGMSAEDLGKHFGEAIKTGDASKVDQAALKEAVGEDNAVLVMAGVSTWAQGAGSAALEAAREVHASVGGSENWSKMTAWAKELVAKDPAQKAKITEITEMLNGNPTARKLGAAEFQKLYNADPKNATVGAEALILGGTQKPSTPSVTPLNPSAAYKAKETAHRQRQLGRLSPTAFQARMTEIQRGVEAFRSSNK